MSDTIAAISSPPGPARRGILRLSGPQTSALLGQVLLDCDWRPGAARGAFEGRLGDGVGSQPLLLLWMPGPYSYTREDVAELHLPGSAPLLQAALQRLFELGARAALAGEFTRRAFQNGRIDLTRAEGVLELVRASTEAERRSALRLLDGGLGQRVSSLRSGLDALRALCEASLDFDETDTGHVPEAELQERMQQIADELRQAMAWDAARQAPSALARVSLFGAPNAGKSSLYNALSQAGEEPALVSDLAGTTRDYLSRIWMLGAQASSAVLLFDTPGLDLAALGAEASAQRLSRSERSHADLVLWVIDANTARPESLGAQARDLPGGVPVLALWHQIDRRGALTRPEGAIAQLLEGHCQAVVPTSALAGTGLEELASRVAGVLGMGECSQPPREGVDGARELFARHRSALEGAQATLEQARAELSAGLELDLVAETLRAATAALDQIEGGTTPEDLLDRIFASFCIGK